MSLGKVPSDILGTLYQTKGYIQPSKDKIEVILKLLQPSAIPELKRFLGMTQYLGKYVPNFAEVLQSMLELLKNDIVWVWNEPREKAFQRVEELLTQTPILTYYDPSKSIMVSADANSYRLEGVIFQEENKTLRVIVYASRTLTQTERNYAQIEKECLASVLACEKFD